MQRTRKGRTQRVLFIIDEYPKCIVASYMAPSIKQEDVNRVLLEAMIREEAQPENIRSDKGSEFIARTVRDGLALRGIKTLYFDSSSPWQNGFIGSFNACARRELLDRDQFYTLSEARVVFAGWIDDYNPYRPHGAIGYLTPDEFTGREPGLRPSGLAQEDSKTTLLGASHCKITDGSTNRPRSASTQRSMG